MTFKVIQWHRKLRGSLEDIQVLHSNYGYICNRYRFRDIRTWKLGVT